MSMLRKTKQQIAHTSMLPSLGNRDLRALQDVINSEKSFIKANSGSAQSWHANAEAIKAWGEGEGEDLSDVLSKLSLLFDHYTAAQTRFDSHLATLRLHFKSIRTREEGLADLKAKKRSLASKIESVERKLAKMGPENKELMKTTSLLKEHRSEMENLRVEVTAEEAAIGDFKRRTAKEAMGLKCGGLVELAEKMTIVGEVGKMIIDQIPLETTEPGMGRADYHGHARTEQLLQEASRSISDVGFAPSNATYGGHRPDLSHHETDYQPDGERGNDQQDDLYSGAHTYNTSADVNQTPIYASHQTTQPWLHQAAQSSRDNVRQDSISGEVPGAHTSGTHTPALEGEGGQARAGDGWGQAADAAINGLGAQEQQGYDATRIADDLPDPSRPWRNSTADLSSGASRAAHGLGDYTSPASHSNVAVSPGPRPEDSQQQHLNSSSAAPSLPPLRASSPLPGGAAASTRPEVDDDESYFASVGSTRAAQAAARRPTSPAPNPRYSTLMTNSGSANSLAAIGATAASQQGAAQTNIPAGAAPYEPSDSGRKMTAAAFRKGFNRVPSAQHNVGGSPSFGQDLPSREGAASPSVAPLAIRKRHSALADSDPRDDDIVPPYPAQETSGGGLQPGQIYNPQHDNDTSAAYDTNDYANYAPPQPAFHHQQGQQRSDSRPGSASGYYQAPSQAPSQVYQHHPTGYGAPYAAGPGP
ncbi:unnamed protein product [Parajaminaea phylloscopi]